MWRRMEFRDKSKRKREWQKERLQEMKGREREKEARDKGNQEGTRSGR